MKRVLTAIVLIPLVLLTVFRAPMWLFALVVLLFAVLATLEYLNIAEKTGTVPFRRLTLIMVAGIFLFAAGKVAVEEELLRQRESQPPFTEVPAQEQQKLQVAWQVASIGGALMLAMPFLFLVRGMRRQDLSTSLSGAALSSFSLFYIVLPLMSLILIRDRPFGSLMLLYLFLVIWAGDIFAYYVGSTIGQHKLAPLISPGKSWEGAVASLLAASILGAFLIQQARPLQQFLESIYLAGSQSSFSPSLYAPPWWHGLLLSMAINIAAQLGDLVESMLKRGAGIKDSGTLLPGHGGVLDRIDSLLFAAPVLLYYANFRGVPF